MKAVFPTAKIRYEFNKRNFLVRSLFNYVWFACFHLYYLHFCISLYTCANVICIKLLLTYLLTYLIMQGSMACLVVLYALFVIIEDAECSDYRYLKCLLPSYIKYRLFLDSYRYFSDVLKGKYYFLGTQCRYFCCIHYIFNNESRLSISWNYNLTTFWQSAKDIGCHMLFFSNTVFFSKMVYYHSQ